MRLLVILTTLCIAFPVFAEEPLQKVSINDIKIIKISVQDEKAVIKTPGRKLQIIKVGDKIGLNGKVTEITKGRIVIEELTDRGMETVIIRVENGDQSVERISRVVMDQGQLYAPSTKGSAKGTKKHEGKK